MNIIERSLAEKANLQKVSPKDQITIEPSVIILSGSNALSVVNQFHEIGYQKVCVPTKVVVAHNTPSNKQGLLKQFCFDNRLTFAESKGQSSIEVLTENRNNLQGSVILGVDPTLSEVGAYEAIPLVLSPTAIVRCLGTGKVEMTIPETVYIEINGYLENEVNAERVVDYLLDYFNDSLVGCGIILGGNTVERLSENERIKLARFIHASGGTLGMVSSKGPLGQVESVVKINAYHIKALDQQSSKLI